MLTQRCTRKDAHTHTDAHTHNNTHTQCTHTNTFMQISSSTLEVYYLREVLPPTMLEGTRMSRVDAFGKEVRKRMSRVLLGVRDWDLPCVDEMPEAWNASMQAKIECLSHLYKNN